MLFGNLNNLDFVRPVVPVAWLPVSQTVPWILEFSDNLLISSPRFGLKPGFFQSGNKTGKLAALTAVVSHLWKGCGGAMWGFPPVYQHFPEKLSGEHSMRLILCKAQG